MAQNSQQHGLASNMKAAPAQPSSKAGVASPKLNNEVEMADMPSDKPADDIMQIARVGDVAAMEKLFETTDLDATYSDEEGITPLHVRRLAAPRHPSAITMEKAVILDLSANHPDTVGCD